jgi:hypothetical protein
MSEKMSEKINLEVNLKNLTNAIKRLNRKYTIFGGSLTGKSEPIALKLSKFCVRLDEIDQLKCDIISLLNEYEDDDLNRKHAFIGISSSDLLIFLFNKEMKLSIENNRLTTIYYGKRLITTRNLHGLLSEDISLPSEDVVRYEVKMTVDINSSCKKVSFIDVVQEFSSSDNITQQSSSNDTINQESSSSDNITQESSSSDNITQESSSSDNITQQSSSSDTINQQEDNLNDVVNQESSSNDTITQQSSSNDTINQQENDLKNAVINDRISNVIMISIVASFIVFLKLNII